MHIALLSDANKLDYDSICALIKSEHDPRQEKMEQGVKDVPTSGVRMSKSKAVRTSFSGYDKSHIICWKWGRRGHLQR